jgi:hypothetical protein
METKNIISLLKALQQCRAFLVLSNRNNAGTLHWGKFRPGKMANKNKYLLLALVPFGSA